MGRVARAVFRAGVWAVAVLAGTGVVLRFTVRDRIDGLAVVFYATPWPVLMAGCAVLAAVFARWHRRALATGFLVVALVAATAWFVGNRVDAKPRAPGDGLRIVLWNVSRPNRWLPSVAHWLRAQDADVIAIAEAHPAHREILGRWREEFPEYQLAALPGNMLCLSRGPLEVRETGTLAPGSHFARLETQVRGRPLTIIQVDLDARPLRSRREPLARLAALVRLHAADNLVVLGDFNTPRESTHFDAFRSQLTNCFESAGAGLAETWPFPLPVLSLDQIWVSQSLRVHRCVHGWPPLSDHRPVVVEVVEAAGLGRD